MNDPDLAEVLRGAPCLEAPLKRLQPALESACGTGRQALREPAMQLVARGGKHLRPMLTFLAAGPDASDDRVVSAAAAIELIHLASLHHDDIMDRGQRRRGQPSVNARWGNRTAMLSGTFLFARAQSLLEPMPDPVRRAAAAAATALCLGQLREAENAFNLELAIEDHLEILRLKTAALFSLAVQAGALLTQAASEVERQLIRYADHLGLAFQLVDDLIDLEGDPEVSGKAIGADIRGGVYSLPLLCLLRAGGEDAAALRRLLELSRVTDDELTRIVELVRGSAGLRDARALAVAHARAAVSALGSADIPMAPAFEALAYFAVSRGA